jgi:hypothetical protein
MPEFQVNRLLRVPPRSISDPCAILGNRNGERSQVVKAVDCGSTTRGFESPRSPFFYTSITPTPQAFGYNNPMFFATLSGFNQALITPEI